MTGTLPGAIGVSLPMTGSTAQRHDSYPFQGLLAFGLVRAHTSVLTGYVALVSLCCDLLNVLSEDGSSCSLYVVGRCRSLSAFYSLLVL